MANIDEYLLKIKSAIYGEEVRGSIHDSIYLMNKELEGYSQEMTSVDYDNLPDTQKHSGKVFYLTDSKQIVKNGVAYGSSEDSVIGSKQGEFIRFDAAETLAKSFKIDFRPIQDDGGWGAVWAGGKGKNLMQVTAEDDVVSGVTIDIDRFGIVTLNGTATADISFRLNETIPFDSIGNFRFTGVPKNQGVSVAVRPSGGQTYYDTGDGVDFTNSSVVATYVDIIVPRGTVLTDCFIKPMIRKQGHGNDAFVPYENEAQVYPNNVFILNSCTANIFDKENTTKVDDKLMDEDGRSWPSDVYSYYKDIRINGGSRITISGVLLDRDYTMYLYFFNSANRFISRFGPISYEDLSRGYYSFNAPAKACFMGFSSVDGVTDPDTIQIEIGSNKTPYSPYSNAKQILDIGSDIWGGTYDVVTGSAKEEWAEIADYNGEPLPGEWMCSAMSYSDDRTPPLHSQVVYKTGSSTAYTANSYEIPTKSGTNTMWANTYYDDPIGTENEFVVPNSELTIEYINSMWSDLPHYYELEEAKYNELPEADQLNGTMYFLTDKGIIMLNGIAYGGGGGGTRTTFQTVPISESTESVSSITVTESAEPGGE